MKNNRIRFRDLNWSLFASLCAPSFIPAVYQVAMTFIIRTSESVL